MNPRILLLTVRRIPTISSNEALARATSLLVMTVRSVSSIPSRPTLAMATLGEAGLSFRASRVSSVCP